MTLEKTRAAAAPRAAARRTFVAAAILPESFDVTRDLLLGDALGGKLPGRLPDRRFESSAPHAAGLAERCRRFSAIRPPTATTPVTSITRSGVPSANPVATVTFRDRYSEPPTSRRRKSPGVRIAKLNRSEEHTS